MKILFIGDIVGSVGRKALKEYYAEIESKLHPHAVIIANGENAAAGRGITATSPKKCLRWAFMAITMGNHTWDQKEIFDFIDDEDKMVRPANFPQGTPGRGYTIIKVKDQGIADY